MYTKKQVEDLYQQQIDQLQQFINEVAASGYLIPAGMYEQLTFLIQEKQTAWHKYCH